MYVSKNKQFVHFQKTSAVLYLGFARGRAERHFLIADVSAGNMTLSHAMQVDQACSRECSRYFFCSYHYYYYHLHYVYGLMDKIRYIQKLNDTESPSSGLPVCLPSCIWGQIFTELYIKFPLTPADHILGWQISQQGTVLFRFPTRVRTKYLLLNAYN